jgi:prolycopene isomerase
MPDLSNQLLFKDAATPYTLYRWTLNYRGAAYGWACMPSQFALPELSKKTSIKNLYLTGHWTTLAQGIPGVVYLGRDTANIILKREKYKE